MAFESIAAYIDQVVYPPIIDLMGGVSRFMLIRNSSGGPESDHFRPIILILKMLIFIKTDSDDTSDRRHRR